MDKKSDASLFWIEFAYGEEFKIMYDKLSAGNKRMYVALKEEGKGSLQITDGEHLKFVFDGACTIREFIRYGSRIKTTPGGHYLGYDRSSGVMQCYAGDIVDRPDGVDLPLRLELPQPIEWLS